MSPTFRSNSSLWLRTGGFGSLSKLNPREEAPPILLGENLDWNLGFDSSVAQEDFISSMGFQFSRASRRHVRPATERAFGGGEYTVDGCRDTDFCSISTTRRYVPLATGRISVGGEYVVDGQRVRCSWQPANRLSLNSNFISTLSWAIRDLSFRPPAVH